MHSFCSPTPSLISLPYCLHPPTPYMPLPGSCLWLFCDPLTLTRAIWVTTMLELSTGACGVTYGCLGEDNGSSSPQIYQ